MDIRILLVADDPDQRQLFALLLEQAGYAVAATADGESALHLLTQGIYHLLLTDYLLPDITGVEVICRARARGFRGRAVLMSHHSDVHSFARQCAADGYFRKEQMQELLALLQLLCTPQ